MHVSKKEFDRAVAQIVALSKKHDEGDIVAQLNGKEIDVYHVYGSSFAMNPPENYSEASARVLYRESCDYDSCRAGGFDKTILEECLYNALREHADLNLWNE